MACGGDNEGDLSFKRVFYKRGCRRVVRKIDNYVRILRYVGNIRVTGVVALGHININSGGNGCTVKAAFYGGDELFAHFSACSVYDYVHILFPFCGAAPKASLREGGGPLAVEGVID